jgi:post-segregation antitoxin CcdA
MNSSGSVSGDTSWPVTGSWNGVQLGRLDLEHIPGLSGGRSDAHVELRAKAKEMYINLSRLLEGALREEIERRETVAQTLEGAEEIKLELEGEGGYYIGRFTGKFIGEGHGVEAYLVDDGRVLVYDSDSRTYWDVTDQDVEIGTQEALESAFPYDPNVVSDVMRAIGETPEIDL